MKALKNFEFILLLLILTFILMSCSRGTYYAPGEDYRYHKERYYKDTYQTMNAATTRKNFEKSHHCNNQNTYQHRKGDKN